MNEPEDSRHRAVVFFLTYTHMIYNEQCRRVHWQIAKKGTLLIGSVLGVRPARLLSRLG